MPFSGCAARVVKPEREGFGAPSGVFRAMAQLERVQRLRGGEAIPAPLTVDVTDRA